MRCMITILIMMTVLKKKCNSDDGSHDEDCAMIIMKKRLVFVQFVQPLSIFVGLALVD